VQKLIVIAGPTAVGKSAVALHLAKKINGEIVSADSVQVYRGLDIGSAKPTAEERAQVPHHLLDIVDPEENYTVADFQRDATRAINDIHRRGKLPLLVGGTGLYIRALVRGFAFTEYGINKELRKKLQKIAASEGPEVLHAKLAKVDPQTAKKLHPNDLRRVIRALEVYLQSKTPISQQAENTPRRPVYDTISFCLTRPRPILYRRIEERVDAMIAAGLVEEVKQILAQGTSPQAKALQSLGYKQIVAFLQKQISLEEAIRLIKRDTRRFAKRQLTWFRKEEMIWLDLEQYRNLDEISEKISTYLQDIFPR